MASASAQTLDLARGGDEDAFRRLIEPLRGRLHAHCYRMLGSVHDADDALQETLLRAWRGLPKFDGRSALGSWLYRIATNTCLNAIAKRPKRVLPVDQGGPTANPDDAVGEPLLESVWIEPYPDAALMAGSAAAAPEARYEERESVELAFIAALQHLPGNQRAALILSEVLGFSAREAAAAMETTTASFNSALQRARKVTDERLPDQSQQATLQALGDERLKEIVGSYIDAMERADVEGLVGLLGEDASWSMPPQPAWFQGRDAIADFLSENPLKYFRWRLLPTSVNGQLAAAAYSWDEKRDVWLAHALNVLTLRDSEIAGVVSYLDVTRRLEVPGAVPFAVSEGIFGRLGLPGELPA